ncbi:uncharacterized protein LOC114695358 [Peromyscus leucopus]|uniref:uncharacterized protein LOC114695358 n=1 Tax=Peromyscus leucopus TaxID=10041 RepID=UPI0018856668|nr:uncharacterized protein LOC114695358 [Peromyscus leucopus]
MAADSAMPCTTSCILANLESPSLRKRPCWPIAAALSARAGTRCHPQHLWLHKGSEGRPGPGQVLVGRSGLPELVFTLPTREHGSLHGRRCFSNPGLLQVSGLEQRLQREGRAQAPRAAQSRRGREDGAGVNAKKEKDNFTFIERFSIPDSAVKSAQDYQLWFCRGFQEAPNLLQEHEHPYDIIMRNIQSNVSQRRRRRRRKSRKCTAFPALPGLYVEQPDLQGRFILKPRDPAGSQKQSNTEEPTVKRRRPFISWLFHKGSVPHQDQVCTTPPVVKTGKLFGKDLTAICEDGTLPTVILVGLIWFFSGCPEDKILLLLNTPPSSLSSSGETSVHQIIGLRIGR